MHLTTSGHQPGHSKERTHKPLGKARGEQWCSMQEQCMHSVYAHSCTCWREMVSLKLLCAPMCLALVASCVLSFTICFQLRMRLTTWICNSCTFLLTWDKTFQSARSNASCSHGQAMQVQSETSTKLGVPMHTHVLQMQLVPFLHVLSGLSYRCNLVYSCMSFLVCKDKARDIF